MPVSLRVGSRVIHLGHGEYLLGRGADCQIAIDDRVASRHHARLRSLPASLTLEDLGSTNGVFVNGARVANRRDLRIGDVIQIGRTEIAVTSTESLFPEDPRPSLRREAKTVDQRPSARLHVPIDTATAGKPAPGADSIDLLAAVAGKALQLGSADKAEQVLAPILTQRLDSMRTGSIPEPEVVESTAKHALQLAVTTGKVVWIERAVEYYLRSQLIMPTQLIDDLYDAALRVPGVRADVLGEYVDALRQHYPHFSASESFALERLEGLRDTFSARSCMPR